MNTIHNAIERRNYLQFDILTTQKVGLNKTDSKGLTPLMKVNYEPKEKNATEMVSELRHIAVFLNGIAMLLFFSNDQSKQGTLDGTRGLDGNVVAGWASHTTSMWIITMSHP